MSVPANVKMKYKKDKLDAINDHSTSLASTYKCVFTIYSKRNICLCFSIGSAHHDYKAGYTTDSGMISIELFRTWSVVYNGIKREV